MTAYQKSFILFDEFDLLNPSAGIEEIADIVNLFGEQHAAVSGKRSVLNDACDVVWPKSNAVVPNKLMPFGKDLDLDYENPDPVEASYKLAYTNKEIDYDLNWHYFGARWYQSNYGRFVSPDPVNGDPEEPLSWNRYLYCRNDPINYFDPDGAFNTLAGWIGAGSGFVGLCLSQPYLIIVGGGFVIYDYISPFIGRKNVINSARNYAFEALKQRIEKAKKAGWTPKEAQELGYIRSNNDLLAAGLTEEQLREVGLLDPNENESSEDKRKELGEKSKERASDEDSNTGE